MLVGASFGGSLEEAVWSLEELEALTDTAGADAVDRVLQQRDAPDPATYLGKGKAREVVDAANALGADLLIFDDELTPAQGRNLEELAGVNPLAERGLKVVDRTGLILDIFAQHARSSEGKLQVELAQLDYRLPRLRGWGDVLSRMGGGIGTRRGPGETQLETDRRAILRRIRRVRSDLAELERRRRLTRRARLGSGVPVVALVGYTNAGKSTLLRGLTGASVLVEDRLFSTLDPVTRRLELPHGRHAVMTDTVGFVHKLPHQLVDAFHSTLEEVGEATLLLHVVDASRDVERQIAAVDEVLAEIGIGDTAPVLAFNKVDRLTEVEVDKLWGRYPQGTFVSATEGTGLRELRERLADELSRLRIEVSLEIPFERGEVVARVHENGEVLAESYSENGTRLRARLQPEALDELADFLTQAPS